MSEEVLLGTVLAEVVSDLAREERFGLRIEGMPKFDLNSFLAELQAKHSVTDTLPVVVVVGATETELNQMAGIYPGHRLFFGVEAAEQLRNDRSVIQTIVLVVLKKVPKLTSLKWFDVIQRETVFQAVCARGLNEFGRRNQPLYHLWAALSVRKVSRTIPLSAVLRYYAALSESQDVPRTAISAMYHLRLLQDPRLLDNSPTTNGIADRLEQNQKLTERITTLDTTLRQSIQLVHVEDENKQRALSAVVGNVLRYYQVRDEFALRRLNVVDVQELFDLANRERRGGTPGRGATGRSRVKRADPVTVDLIIEDDRETIKALVTAINSALDNWVPDKSSKVDITAGPNAKIQIKLEPEIRTLLSQFIGGNSYGGIIRSGGHGLRKALRDLQRYSLEVFDEKFVSEIQSSLTRFAEIAPELHDLAQEFGTFIQLRRALVGSAELLAYAPVLSTCEPDDFRGLVARYVSCYGRFLALLWSNYTTMLTVSNPSTRELIPKVLVLDTVLSQGAAGTEGVLTSLHPLFLWKYVELVRRLLETRSSLQEDEKALLVKTAARIPNPLTTLFVSQILTRTADQILPHTSNLGCLPVYAENGEIGQDDSVLTSLRDEVVPRFLNLYPHSALKLRMAFVNPSSVRSVLSVAERIIGQKGAESLDILVYHTRPVTEDWSSLSDVDEYAHAFMSRVQSDGRNSVTVKSASATLRQVADELCSHPVHLAVISDVATAHTGLSRRDPLQKIHPLCVPKVIRYDQVRDEIEVQPASEGHIFTDHHNLINAIGNRPIGSHYNLTFDLREAKADLMRLLQGTEWLVVADSNLEIGVFPDWLRILSSEGEDRNIAIFTNNWPKLERLLARHIKRSNYDPDTGAMSKLIRFLNGLAGDTVFRLVKLLSGGLDANHAQGALATAIAAVRYRQAHPNALLVSLDSDLARYWLDVREEQTRSDLIGIRSENGLAIVDVIEVKAYEEYSRSEGGELKGRSIEQLTETRRLLREMLVDEPDLLTASRLEALRLQVYRALYGTVQDRPAKAQWTAFLNELFARHLPCRIDATLFVVESGLARASYSDTGTVGSDHVTVHRLYKDVSTPVLERAEGAVLDLGVLEDTRDQRLGHAEVVNRTGTVGLQEQPHIPVVERRQSDQVFPSSTVDTYSQFQASPSNDSQTTEPVDQELQLLAERVFRALRDYGIQVAEVDPALAQVAARFTRIRIRLRSGETLQKVRRFADDLARELEATGALHIDNERGTPFIFIDIPRSRPHTLLLENYLDLLAEPQVGLLRVVLGQEAAGRIIVPNLETFPHLLVAGTTGSGKTMFLYSLVLSLVHQFSPEQLQLVIVDPKQTDFVYFEGLAHLRGGAVILEPEDALNVLRELFDRELAQRTAALREARCRDIQNYNESHPSTPMRPIVVLIDEYADLIQAAEVEGHRDDFERMIVRMAQRSRNVGIHLVIATQHPRADIVTSTLKANMPTRVALRVPAHQDSMVILDSSGAEELLGNGDLLLLQNGEIKRVQGVYISQRDLEAFLLQVSRRDAATDTK